MAPRGLKAVLKKSSPATLTGMGGMQPATVGGHAVEKRPWLQVISMGSRVDLPLLA